MPHSAVTKAGDGRKPQSSVATPVGLAASSRPVSVCGRIQPTGVCCVRRQVSKDGLSWTTLYMHIEDTSLNEPGSTASWPLLAPTEETQVSQSAAARCHRRGPGSDRGDSGQSVGGCSLPQTGPGPEIQERREQTAVSEILNSY